VKDGGSVETVPNINTSELRDEGHYRRVRLAELAGAEHLGMTLYELAPGQGMDYHYHLQREELLVVLEGTVAVRTAEGWRDVPQGEVLAFPRGERGVHGYENRGDEPVRLVMISEQNAPNVSVYPDANQVGIYDVAPPAERRFGGLFNLADAVSPYGSAKPEVPLPRD
jgi:uncharacterized cupin superfamily protein